MIPRSVAVTGACGRLGRVLVPRLLEAGVERVVAIDRVPPRGNDARVEARRIDVRDPALAVELRGCDALVHLAFVLERAGRDRREVRAVNVEGTRNAIACAARAGCQQLVYTSSAAVYGFHPENFGCELDEGSPIRENVDFSYACDKAEIERWLDGCDAGASLSVCRLRPSLFVGPLDLGRVCRWPVFPYVAGSSIPVQVTHVHDVARAILLALGKRARGAYNVAASEPLPMSEWAKHLGMRSLGLAPSTLRAAELLYRARLLPYDPIWLTIGRTHPLVLSAAKIRDELGWTPAHATASSALRAIAREVRIFSR